MSGLFKTKTVSTTAEKLSNFNINSATYGEAVPDIIGTTRVSGNVIDWFDFTPIAHTTTTRAGKGGGTKTQNTDYTYTVACLIGLGEGPITGIGKVWKDKETYDSLSGIGMTLFKGEYGQSPWAYTQGKYPEKALPYSGLAYVAGVIDLGNSNGLPTLNFELKGRLLSTGDGVDANPADAIKHIGANSMNGINIDDAIDNASLDRLRTYAKATDLLVSLPPDANQKSYEIINDFCSALDTSVFLSEDKIKFVPLCMDTITANGTTYTPNSTVLYDLTADDFLPMDDGVLVRLERVPDAKAYNQYTVSFLNRANAYESETVDEQILVDVHSRGLRPADSITMNFFHTKQRASYVAKSKALNSLTRRNQYTFRLDSTFCLLEPGDLLSLTDAALGITKQPVVVDDWQEINDEEIEVTAFGIPRGNYSAGIYNVHQAERPSINYGVAPDDTTATIFNVPAELTENGLETWIAASGGDNWSGCTAWVSDSDEHYVEAGQINGPARHGVLTAALPTGAAIDTVNTLKVQLMGGDELQGGTEEDALNLNTLMWVDGELIAYRTATLTGTKQYSLTYLVRGAYNTPITAHASGSKFVRLDRNLFKYPFNANQINKKIYIKLTARNAFGIAEQSLADVEATEHTLTAQSPPNVSNIVIDENTFILRDGTALSDILVSFTEPNYLVLDHYNVYYDLNNSGRWRLASPATKGECVIKSLPQAQSVKVKITTVNKAMLESSGTISAAYTITGKSDPPPNVTGLTAEQDEYNRANVVLKWAAFDPGNTPDLKGYEIRLGSVWETAIKLNPDPVVGVQFVHGVTANGSYTFLVKAIDNSGNYSQSAASKSITIIVVPDAPTNLIAVQDQKDRSILKISWTASSGKDIAGYELKLGTNWDTGQEIDSTRETSYKYTIPASGTFTIMVKAKTVAGYYSNIANISVTAMIEAYDVTGFAAMQMIADRTRVRLSWDKPLSLDVAYFEIRKGATWDSGQIIESRATGTFYDVVVTQETEQTFWIKAVTVAGKYSQYPAMVSDIFNLRPNPVSNIRITQQPNDKSVVVITWDATPESDLAGYQVKVGYVWETAEALPPTKELTCLYNPSSSDNLKVMIKALNAAGYYSDEVFKVYYATLEPLAVTGFQVLQNGENVQFYWDKHPENDVVAYEIREGASFDGGTLIDTGITLNSHSVKVDVERNYQYHIKAINRSNRYSQTSAKQTIYVSNLPPKNVILEYDEITRQDGSHNNTEFGLSAINWQTIGGGWNDHPGVKFSEVGGQNVLKLRNYQNLCTKPDFSSGWYFSASAVNAGVVDTMISGKTHKALKLKYTGSGDGYALFSMTPTESPAGKNITLSFYIWADSAVSIFSDCYIQGTGTPSGWTTKKIGAVGTVPTKVVLTGVVPSNATMDNFRIVFRPPNNTTATMFYSKPMVEYTDIAHELDDYYPYGQYDCQRVDIGQVTTCNIGNLFTSSVNLRGVGSAKLQIRTSQNGTDFTNWQDFRPAEYTFRYLDRRVLLETDDPTNTPEVGQFSTRIDVPDTTQTGTVTVPVGGISVLYSKAFYTDPVVTGAAIGANRLPEITTETKYGHTIKIVDRTGADVGGKYNYSAKGY